MRKIAVRTVFSGRTDTEHRVTPCFAPGAGPDDVIHGVGAPEVDEQGVAPGTGRLHVERDDQSRGGCGCADCVEVTRSRSGGP